MKGRYENDDHTANFTVAGVVDAVAVVVIVTGIGHSVIVAVHVAGISDAIAIAVWFAPVENAITVAVGCTIGQIACVKNAVAIAVVLGS